MPSQFSFAPEIEALPWETLRPGMTRKLIQAEAPGGARALLLRLEPGTIVPRHRHSGEVHALTLAGQRKLLDSGRVVGPGGYVYEPDGNVDSWMAVGDEPLIVFLTARGAVEYLAEASR
jgi:quercetin dioxygenase-like cupin family protein